MHYRDCPRGQVFSTKLVLRHLDPKKPFVTSDITVVTVLPKENEEGKSQPCGYTSRKLTETEQQWAVWEKGAYAVRWALLTWRYFLDGNKIPFQVWIDHKKLEVLKTLESCPLNKHDGLNISNISTSPYATY